jgi:putative ABC transport system substrate-binding protein
MKQCGRLAILGGRGSSLKRRDFIALTGGVVVGWPLGARAQQPAMPVVGFLSSGSKSSDGLRLTSFWRGLNEAGYVEGRNVASEYRWADDQYDKLPPLAADLAHHPISVIAAIGTPASALAAKAATRTIPIIFAIAGDPTKLGLVVSFNRPGGNVTGATTFGTLIVPKQFEVLHETIPKARLVGCLVNPLNPNAETNMREAREASDRLGLQLDIFKASTESDIDTAFAKFIEHRADAVVVVSDALFNSRPNQLTALAARHALPAIYQYREFAAAGGLISYGSSLPDAYRQIGIYTGRILKGEKVGDLPVVQSTKVELILNLKTAKALGITFPISLLGRADEVIE